MPSTVWESFIKTGPDTVDVMCKICGAVVSNKGGSTSSMRRHLQGIHKIPQGESSAPNQAGEGKLVVLRNLDYSDAESKRKTITTMLASMIACDELPLMTVEKPGFRAFVEFLEPGYDVPCMSNMTLAIANLYYTEKQKLADILDGTDNVALTTDCWTSCTMEGYMTVTAHYISQDHKLVSRVLDTSPVGYLPREDDNPQPEGTQRHTADAIAHQLSAVTEEWRITDKVTAVVHDNTSNVKNISDKAQLPNSCNVPCAAHTIQSSLNKGMAIAQIASLVGSANRLIAYCQRSIIATEVLETKPDLGLQPDENKLVTSCPSRWNSVLAMFERLLTKRCEICAVLSDQNYTEKQDAQTLELNDDSWELMEELVKCLIPFRIAITVLSADLYVSLSIVQPCVQALLKDHLGDSPADSPTVRLFKARVSQDLAGQFPTINPEGKPSPLCIAAALDPRFKNLERFIGAGPAVGRISEEVRRQLQLLVAQQHGEEESEEPAAKKARQAPSGLEVLLNLMSSSADGEEGEENSGEEMDEYERFRVMKSNAEGITTNTDPLEWWKINSARFPSVARLADRYLCIPASSVPSERVFSAAGNIVNAKRSALKPDTVNMLIFLNKITENE